MRNKTSVTVLDFVCFKPLVIMCVCKQFHLFKKQKKTIITEYLPPPKKKKKKQTNTHTHTHTKRREISLSFSFLQFLFCLHFVWSTFVFSETYGLSNGKTDHITIKHGKKEAELLLACNCLNCTDSQRGFFLCVVFLDGSSLLTVYMFLTDVCTLHVLTTVLCFSN